MSSYTLPTFTLFGDTYRFELLNAPGGLTVPPVNCCTNIGKFKEKLDGDGFFGSIIPENVQLEFIDIGNFFYNLINGGGCDIQIYRNNVLKFYGLISGDSDINNSSFPEYFVSGTEARRKAVFTCVSMMYKLKNTTAAAILENIVSNDATHPVINSTEAFFISINSLFAPFTMDCLGTDYVDASPIIPNNDFEYFIDTTEIDFIDLLIYIGTVGEHPTSSVYFDPVSSQYLGTKYKNALELLAAFAKSFGFIPKIFYDVDLETWKLKLQTRRKQSFSPMSEQEYLISSKLQTKISGAKNIRVNNPDNSSSDFFWMVPGETDYHMQSGGTAPKNIDFDLDFTPLWVCEFDTGYPDDYKMYFINETFDLLKINNLKYFDYNLMAFEGPVSFSSLLPLSFYFKSQFSGSKKEFVRQYKEFSNISTFDIVYFYVGVVVKNFYVTDKEQDPKSKTETFTYIEI